MNKEELKKEAVKLHYFDERNSKTGHYFQAVEDMLKLINQLEEPEITEEKVWEVIAENYLDEWDGKYALSLWKDMLANGIKEKPVVPQFVAEWLQKAPLKGLTLVGAMDNGIIKRAGGKHAEELAKHLVLGKNQELFARAWIDGYTVEEKKYRLDLPGIGEVNNLNGTKLNYVSDVDAGLTKEQIDSIYPFYMTFAEEVDA